MRTFFRNILVGSASISLFSNHLDFKTQITQLNSISEIISYEKNLDKETALKKYFSEYFLGQLLTFILCLFFISLAVLTSVFYNDYIGSLFAILNFSVLLLPKFFYYSFSY